MSEFKGTPGPWNVQFGDEIYAGDGVDNEQVATANDCHDADLIAAAPELLEALQAMLSKAYKQNWNDKYPEEVEAAQAAISKALGQ